MDFNSTKPIYIQIKEYYQNLIDSGALKEGDEMPSVRDIAIIYNINPNTVQRALTLLVEEGYLLNIPKKGFYVNKINTKNHDYLIKNRIDELNSSGIGNEEIMDYLMRLKQ